MQIELSGNFRFLKIVWFVETKKIDEDEVNSNSGKTNGSKYLNS
jgi:hypothetical protein